MTGNKKRNNAYIVLAVSILLFFVIGMIGYSRGGRSAYRMPKPYDFSAGEMVSVNDAETGDSESDFRESIGKSASIADSAPELIPDYAGKDVIELNGNVPNFTAADVEAIEGENFAALDELGRCGTAFAKLERGMMPTEPRGYIGDIKPTGWKQNKYPGIVNSEPPYLYNRCHLIAYALTGQNDNPLNLITGTRYMNASLMLPYEDQVRRYLEDSENHVLYRISPYFKENELLARGIEMEAYSVEDKGAGVSYHVFIYNVQPGIRIDYRTGENTVEAAD